MYLNVLIFILVIGLVQGILLGTVLLVQKKVYTYHVFLGAYIAAIILQLVFKVVSKLWLMDNWLQAYLLSYFVPFLYGPLILLFARSFISKDFKWAWQYLLHFIPFLLYMGFYAFANPDHYPPAVMIVLLHPVTRFSLQLISIATYHIYVFRMLGYNKDQKSFFKTRKSFLKKFTAVSFIVTGCIAATLLFLYVNYPYFQQVRWVFILLTVFIYWLSYEGLKKPEIFRVIHGRAEMAGPAFHISPLVAHHKPAKYLNSGLKENEIQRIREALASSMEIDKLYLDADLNIAKLADAVGCPRHHLSQVLNTEYHASFNEYINQKRVAEARGFLSDQNLNHIKIASIAYDSGFNSLSSFNSIFKKLEGITPSQFRITAHQEHSQIRRV